VKMQRVLGSHPATRFWDASRMPILRTHGCFSNQEHNRHSKSPQQHSGGGKMDPASPNVLDGQVRRSDRR
jgi:hypothetical protein